MLTLIHHYWFNLFPNFTGIKYENYRKKYTTTSDGHGRSQVQPSTPDPTKGRLSHKRKFLTKIIR